MLNATTTAGRSCATWPLLSSVSRRWPESTCFHDHIVRANTRGKEAVRMAGLYPPCATLLRRPLRAARSNGPRLQTAMTCTAPPPSSRPARWGTFRDFLPSQPGDVVVPRNACPQVLCALIQRFVDAAFYSLFSFIRPGTECRSRRRRCRCPEIFPSDDGQGKRAFLSMCSDFLFRPAALSPSFFAVSLVISKIIVAR